MPRSSQFDPSQVIALLLALGVGLLIGLERERRKGAGPDRRAAGIRSFALVAVSGALAQLLAVPGLVVVGGASVVLLAAISHLKSRSGDPGLTTEVALFLTYLVGVLVASQPLLGSACGVALALLLNTRTRLHRFATHVLTEQELHDGLLLCAAALIVLPLTPNRPLAWLGDINPRPLAAIAVLILTLQAVGHVAVRWLGLRLGLVAAGFVAGFASSTAAIAALGRQGREQPARAGLLSTAAAWSTAATWVLVMVMAGALSIDAALALAPVAGAGGLMLSVAVAGLADAHAPVASLAALFDRGQLPRNDLIVAVLLAITANSATRLVVALVSGGLASGLRVGAALASGLVGAWVAWAWST